MKHNFMTKMVSALLAVVLSTAAFSITAFASGGEESTESVTEQETVGDVSDLLSALAGSQVTVSVTEDGIQFSSGENDSGQTGTVTTGGGNLNVRTGAGMDYTAFTQIPNGTTVKVIGTDGDWLKVILPEKVGYVYSGYMTVSDGEAGSGEGSFSLDTETLENLLGMLGGGLNGGVALTPDGNLSLIDDIGSPTASGKQFTHSFPPFPRPRSNILLHPPGRNHPDQRELSFPASVSAPGNRLPRRLRLQESAAPPGLPRHCFSFRVPDSPVRWAPQLSVPCQHIH